MKTSSAISLADVARLVACASPPVRSILENALSGDEVSRDAGEVLFAATYADMPAIRAVADHFREVCNGDRVSFVVNRNINFTNICYMGCRFCAFAKRAEAPDAEWLSIPVIVNRAKEAWRRGGSEVCIQGGLHPKMDGNTYREIVQAIKSELPRMHVHAFSPFEIWYGATKTKQDYRSFLTDLKTCGLGSMPGTAAEILDVDVRRQLTRNKLSTEAWVEIIRTAHSVGIRTSATIMYGHVDGPRHWASHIDRLRSIQKETGGFTELVPLSFVHAESPLYLDNPKHVRPGPSEDEVDKMHAVSRIMLRGWIDNIQVSWTKLGPERARELLSAGVNDMGGTLMNESISRAAGATHGQEMTAKELCDVIRSAGRVPVRRNTLYEILDVFDDHDPVELDPLVARQSREPLAFLKSSPERQTQA